MKDVKDSLGTSNVQATFGFMMLQAVLCPDGDYIDNIPITTLCVLVMLHISCVNTTPDLFPLLTSLDLCTNFTEGSFWERAGAFSGLLVPSRSRMSESLTMRVGASSYKL